MRLRMWIMVGLAVAVALAALPTTGSSAEVQAPPAPAASAAVPAAVASPAPAAEPDAASVSPTEYAGAETCRECHAMKGFESTTHGREGDPRSPAGKQGCESCHGPAKRHTLDPDHFKPANLFGRKSPLTAKQQDAVCLKCHVRGRQLWQGSVHQSHKLSCTTCHSAHKGNNANLQRPIERDVCLGCHKNVKADIQKMSHHPIREGKVTCSNCHNPHGTNAPKLISANNKNEKCYECHADKRGPFLWPHSPVIEGCTTCHTPHGSPRDKLLIAKPPYLCQQCHSNSRHPGTLYARNLALGQTTAYQTSSRLFYRACLNCHPNIHGSNHPSGKYLGR